MATKTTTPDEIPVCEECGQPHVTRTGRQACTGHSRGRLRPEIAGKACRQSPWQGQRVCGNHGAKAPQALAAAEMRLAEAKVAALAITLGGIPEGAPAKDPGEVVAEQIQWRYWRVQWLRARVQAIDPKDLVWGRTKKKRGGDDHGTTHEAKPNVWAVMLFDAERDLEKLCIDAIRAGLEERRVRIAEQYADAMVSLLDGLLIELGHDPADPGTAEVVERHLRSLAA